MPRITKKTVINPTIEQTEKAETKTGDVLAAYNGVQAQRFDIPTAGGRKTVIINGNNTDLIGKTRGALYAGGYGLTSVDREAWEYIKEHYKNWPPIKNGLMFATDSARVNDEIKDRAGLKNGFEPLSKDSITGVQAKE